MFLFSFVLMCLDSCTLTQYYSPYAPTIFHFAPKFKVILLIKQNMYIEKEKMKNMLMTKAYHP
jgi:hypothetical protein